MFDLEESIADWRQQMLAAGLVDSRVLDELESHLRDEMQRPLRTGLSQPAAFDIAVRQIGQGHVLKSEFAKTGGTLYQELKRLLCRLAGIPEHRLATNMNTSDQNLESSWATYLKTFAFVVPGALFWMGACVFVAPKMREVCAASGTPFPGLILTVLALSDFLRNNLIYASVLLFTILALLEWRSHGWPRYRRKVFGVVAFISNFGALVVLTTMLVFAVIGGANLLHHTR